LEGRGTISAREAQKVIKKRSGKSEKRVGKVDINTESFLGGSSTNFGGQGKGVVRLGNQTHQVPTRELDVIEKDKLLYSRGGRK